MTWRNESPGGSLGNGKNVAEILLAYQTALGLGRYEKYWRLMMNTESYLHTVDIEKSGSLTCDWVNSHLHGSADVCTAAGNS